MRSNYDGVLNTKPRPNAGQEGRGNSTCTPSGAEVIDLTHLINEPNQPNRRLSHEREVDDDGLFKNQCQSTVPKQFEDLCNESLIDENWLEEDDTGTQIGTQPENSCDPAQKCRSEVPLAGVEDPIMLDGIDGVGAQASEASHHEVTPIPPTRSLVTNTEQPTQRTTGRTPIKAKIS
ncbi:hypothetical protein DM02DRAFT_347086 [Periconia macrospinosa]|uniref:Uncharacterized protein n=1 Tax=Periconia macrospinosa TaxID=97972 RepID=A0A2V1D040_9PLEO|nr:hypothetical protein DM02DRAFT_347086 [Periconia macrospinosa]